MDNREGRIVRNRRLELGFTQEEVAQSLGMSIHQYQRYEYGGSTLSNARMKIGLRICAVLRLEPFDVVFGNK